MAQYTQLEPAIKNNNYDQFCDLISSGKIDVDEINSYNNSNLHLSTFSSDIRFMEKLLKEGANTETRNQVGCTPLHYIASRMGNKIERENSLKQAKLLRKYGAKVNTRDKFLSTPLHTAAYSGHVEFLYLLLKAGADVDAKDDDGGTALHNAAFACPKYVEETIFILLKYGADIKTRSKDGILASHLTFRALHYNLTKKLIKRELKEERRLYEKLTKTLQTTQR